MTATSAALIRLTATKPVSSADSIVFGASLNYVKFKLYTSVSQTTNIAVYGWNYVQETATYVPQLLVLLAGANTAASSAIPGIGTVFEITSWTPTQGDSKNYNGTATNSPGGFILVDTLGCEYIEVRPFAAASANVTVLAAGL